MFSSPQGLPGRPYTKWYRVWERTTIADFYTELFIIPVLLAMALMHILGSRVNQRRARQWAAAHMPLLDAEYAAVGFEGAPRASLGPDAATKALRSNAADEYVMYATGRANVACLDIKLSLFKRHNPFVWLAEAVMAFFIESLSPPAERVVATALCFDGKEKALLPGTAAGGNTSSAFDGFVWAIVHKDQMKRLRIDRYDLSLTTTRDNPKLPEWATIMTEAAEITDVLLTPDLIKAVHEAGEDLESLIVSDQPVDAPKK